MELTLNFSFRTQPSFNAEHTTLHIVCLIFTFRCDCECVTNLINYLVNNNNNDNMAMKDTIYRSY